jgi:hypothetical protein
LTSTGSVRGKGSRPISTKAAKEDSLEGCE